MVVLLFIGAIAAVASSPFGIFFAADRNGPDTVSVAEAIAQVNRDYNARLEELQAGDYDSISASRLDSKYDNNVSSATVYGIFNDDGEIVTIYLVDPVVIDD